VTTADLDALAEKRIARAGATPAFKGYHGYPATICASINEEVIHGIPSGRRVLNEGDVISIDVGASLNGYYGDSAITLPVGQVSEEAATLLRVTEESLYKAIDCVRPGARISDIGHAVQHHVEAYGFSVVREFVGHGIGQRMHEEPQVPNYGEPGRGPRLAEGMVLAIEPMVNAGKPAVKVLADGWTAVTRDGGLSAHFEHTVAVTADGPWILTAREVPVGPDRGASVAGTVTETLPHAMYRVRLEQGSLVMAHIADRMDRNFVRILVGDRVRLELSPLDAGRGRIVEKL
jgi:methionyl aminopeptidase